MANRYWVDGTGTWTTTTTNWSATSGGASGASAPTSADSVFFDQAGTYTVTMTGTLNCLDITVSAGTVTFTSTGTLFVAGSMTLSASTVWSATGTLTFSSTSTGRTITTNNITINAATVTFNGSGGAWTLGSSFITATTTTTSYLTGTLNLVTFTWSTGIFSSSSGLTRVITFGSGNIDLTHTTPGTTVLSMTDGSNFSYTGTGGFSSNIIVARTFRTSSGFTASNAPNLFITGSSPDAVYIFATSYFNTLDFTGSTSTVSGGSSTPSTSIFFSSLILASGGAYTGVSATQWGTGTISGNGRTISALTINTASITSTISTALTVTATTTFATSTPCTLILNATLITGLFSASGSSTRSIAFDVNYITTTTNGLTISDATNFTWTGTGGFRGNMNTAQSFTFGVASGASATNAINLFIFSGAATASISTGSHIRLLDCTGSVSQVNPSTASLAAINVYDSAILSSTGTYPFLQLDMKSTTNTINGNGRTIGRFTIASGATTTLLSALTINSAYTHVANTTLALSTFTLTTTSSSFTYTGGTFSMGTGTISCITFTLNGPSFTLNSGTINCSTGFTLTSGNFTLDTGGTLGAIPTFTHTAGTVTFLKSVAFATSGTYQFIAGTLNVTGVTLSVGIFSSSSGLTRVITFGSGNIDLTHATSNTLVIAMSDATNFTWTGTGGFTANMGVKRGFRFGNTSGGSISNAINLSLLSGGGEINLTAGSWFKNLNFTGSTGLVIAADGSGATLTSLNLQVLTLAGGTYSNIDAVMNTSCTIVANSKTINSLSINVAGAVVITGALTVTGTCTFGTTQPTSLSLSGDLTVGTFSSSSTSIRSISFDVNFITTTTGGLSMAAANNFTYSGTGGFRGTQTVAQTYNFGSSSGGSASNAPNLTLIGSGNGATISAGSWFKNLTFTSVSTVSSTGLGVNVNALTLAASANYSSFNAVMYGTSSINGNGRTIANFTFFGPSDTCNFQSALGISGPFTIGNTNTLNLAGFTFTVTGGITCNTSSSIINFGTTSCTAFTVAGPNITVNSGSLNCTGFTITSGTYTLGASGAMASLASITHTAGNVTFLKSYALTTIGSYNFTSGTLTVTGVTLSTGEFNSSNTNVRNLIINTGFIDLTRPNATVVSMADVTNLICTATTGGFTVSATSPRTITYGTTGGSVDNSPNLTLTSGFSVITLTTGSFFKNLNFGTTTFAVPGTILNLSGFALSASGTYTSMNINLLGSVNNTITGNSRTIGALTINKPSTTNTFQSALSCTTLTQTVGDINFATFNLTCSSTIAFTSGTYTNMGVLQCTTFTLNGIFNLSSGTLTPTVSFVLGSGTFTYAATATLSTVATFTHTAGSATFSKAYALTATGTYTLTAGDLILNGVDLSTGIFSSPSAGIRSIQFGTNNIVLAHTSAAQTVLNIPDASSLTITGTGGFTASATLTRTYLYGSTSGGSATNSPNLFLTGNGTSIATITSGSWFNTLNFGATAFAIAVTTVNINAITLSSGGTFTNITVQMRGTGLITTSGKTIAGFLLNTIGTNTLAGNVTCTSYTQTAGLLDLATFNIICSGAISVTGGSTINSGTITCTTFTVNGTFSLDSGTITPSVSFVILSGTFTYNLGGTLSPVPTFTQSAGTVNLGKAYALTATGTYTFSQGILNLGGFNLTTGIFSSSSPSTRSILFGANNIILAHPTAGQTVLAIATTTGFSNTGTGGFTANASVTRTYTFGTTGGTFNIAPNLSITSGVEQPTITTGSWFKVLDFTGSSTIVANTTLNIDTLILSSGGTYTGLTPHFTRSQTWTAQFSKQLGGIGINALFNTLTLDNTQTYTPTSVCSVISGTLNLGGANLTIGSFSSSGVLTRSVIFGSNNIILSTPTAGVTVLSVADATNFSCSFVTGGFVADSGITRTFTFGTTSGTSLTAPNLTINSGSAIPTITTDSWFHILDFTGSSCTPAVATLNVTSAILSSGGTFTNLSLTMRSNGSITPAGKTISAFVVNHTDLGTTTIVSTLNCATQTYTAGNVDFNNSNVTSSAGAAYSSGIFSNINTITSTTFTVTGAFTLTQGTIAPSVSIILTSGSITYNGGTINAVPTFTHTAGTFILGQAYALTATGTYTLTSGSIVLNGYNLSTGIFSSTGIVSRSISFSTGNINLTHSTAAQIVLNMADVTNFTQSATTGGFVSNATVTRTFTFGTTGGTVTNAPNLAITTGSAVPTITNLSWFNTLTFDGSSTTPPSATLNISTLILSVGGTYTGLVPVFTRTQTWTSQFSKQLGGIGFNLGGGTLTLDGTQTYTATSVGSLTNGTLSLGGNQTFGTFVSNNTNTRSIIFGSNNIILATTTVAATNLDMGNATNFTISGTGGFTAAADITRTFTFGTVTGLTTNSPNLTLTGSGVAVQTFTSGSSFNTLNFGTTAFTVPTTSISTNNLTLSSGGTFSGLTANMFGTGTITPNTNTTLGNLIINGQAGSITTSLASALTLTATGSTVLTNGTLNLNGFNLTTGIFSSTNTNTRSISFGTNDIVLAHTTAGVTVLSMADVSNLTVTGTGGFTAAANITRTYVFGTTGGSSTTAPNLTLTGSGTAVQTFTTNSWFNNLDFGTSAFTVPGTTLNISTLILSSDGTYTGLAPTFTRTQTWTPQFSKQLNGIGVNGSGVTLTLSAGQTYTATSQCSLTLGTIDLGGADLTIGTFVSNNSNIRSLVLGSNNIILSTTTAGAVNLDMNTATNFTISGTGGFTAAADITRTFRFGGSETNSPNLTFTGSGTAIQTFANNSWFNTLNFGTTAFTLPTVTLNLNSLILSTGAGVYTNLSAFMRGTGTITANGKTIAGLLVQSTGTTTLASALSMATTTANNQLVSGTLDLAGFTLTCGRFVSSNSNTRGITFGTGNIVLTDPAVDSTLISMDFVFNFSCSGTGGFVAGSTIPHTFKFGINAGDNPYLAGATSANAPNLRFTGTGAAVQTLKMWCNHLDFGTTTFVFTNNFVGVRCNSLTLSAGVAATAYQGLLIEKVGTGTITSNGKNLGTLKNTAGTTTLVGNLALNPSAAGLLDTTNMVLTAGTIDLNGYTLTTNSFSSNNENTRSVIFGTSNIIILGRGGGGGGVLMDTITNFTWSGSTGGFLGSGAIGKNIIFGSTAGGSVSNAVNVSLPTNPSTTDNISSNSWLKNLNFTGSTASPSGQFYVDTLTLATGGTYTGITPIFTRTQTWTAQFSKQLGGIGFNLAGGTLTLDNTQTYVANASNCFLLDGTLNLGGSDLTIGLFDSNTTNTRSVAFGSNNIILSGFNRTVLNVPDATNFTYTGAGGFVIIGSFARTYTFGTTGGSTTNAPNLSFNGGPATQTITNGSWFKTVTCVGTNEIVGACNLDTITLATGGTYTGFAPIFTRTQTWTTQFSKQLGGIGVNGLGVTLTLEATQTYSGVATLIVNAGTLDISTLDLSFYNFSSTGTGARSITGTGSINISNNWTVTSGSGFTGSGYSIKMSKFHSIVTSKIFAGGGGSYGTLVQQTASQLNITGSNTFVDIQVNNNMVEIGQQEFTTAGTYSWTAPSGVTSVSVVAVGAGGGGYSSGINTTAGQGGAGGGLGWKNNISVTPGQSYTVVVGQGYRCTVSDSTKANDGGPSYFIDLSTVAGLGGESGDGTSINAPDGGTYVGDGGGTGGSGAVAVHRLTQGAGGAGGYSGNGGNGGVTGVAGSGGGGGGTSQVSCASGASASGSGGGVGIYGEGASGVAGTGSIGGGGGSAGVAGGNGVGNNTNDASTSSIMGSRSGGLYGGGGGAFSGTATPANSAAGAGGAVRIIWGAGRAFPSTNTGDIL